MRIRFAALFLILFTAQAAFAQADSDEQDLVEMRRSVHDLRMASGTVLGLGVPTIAGSVITGFAALGRTIDRIGCTLGCPSERGIDRLTDASLGLGVVGGALLLSGLGVAIAHGVQKKRLARLERRLEDDRFERRRLWLRDRQRFESWQLDGVSFAPILRGDAADGAIGQISLRF